MDLGRFYPEAANDPYLRKLCEKGAQIAKDETATLNRPEDIIDMIRLALYDVVIYCGMWASVMHYPLLTCVRR